MPGKTGETAPMIQQVSEESRDEEEKLHPECVRGEREPGKSLARGDVCNDSVAGRRAIVPGRVEDDAKQQRESACRIEGVETICFGGVAHNEGCLAV